MHSDVGGAVVELVGAAAVVELVGAAVVELVGASVVDVVEVPWVQGELLSQSPYCPVTPTPAEST